MHVRTLTGQIISLTEQIATLMVMSDQRTFGETDNIALQKRMGCRIITAAGPDALLAVLDELKADIKSSHHKVLTSIWRPIANPYLRPR